MKKLLSFKFIYLCIYLFVFATFISLVQRFAEDNLTFEILANHVKLEMWVQEHFPGRYKWFELFGMSNKITGKKVVLVDDIPIIQLENNSLISGEKNSDMQYQLMEMCKLADTCRDLNKDLLYVNYPGKLKKDTDLEKTGYPSYSIKNANHLLRSMKKYGIDTLDIREQLEDKADYYSWFYKTDHHWTTKAGLLAAKNIVKELNEKYNYQMNEAILAENQFIYKSYPNCWLGENGRRLSKTYSGLDDFTTIQPKYETSLTYGELKGDFSILMNENIYKNQNNLYTTSWHYSYLPLGADTIKIHNHNVSKGKKILLVKDSFSVVVAPFLALVCEEIYFWDVRFYHESSLIEFIKNNDFDCVLVCYMEQIIQKEGMFTFDDKLGSGGV